MDSRHMSATYLRSAGASYLRYDLQCPIVTFERGLKEYHGYNSAPDLFAINKRRMPIEVEIKVSFSDFKANFKKRIFYLQRQGYVRKPFEFYFLVPPHLVERVKTYEGITWEGVLTTGTRINPYTGLLDIATALPCKTHKKAKKLDLKQLITMVRNQSGSLVTMLATEAKEVHRLEDPRFFQI